VTKVGIFPHWTGPTTEYRQASIYPDWMAVVVIEEPEKPGIGIPSPGGPDAESRYYDRYAEPEDLLMAQIRREDEEILSIIVISMEVLH
jgi:hypothetical protein